MVRISAAAPGRIVTKERLEEMGLVAASEPEVSSSVFAARTQAGK
jgi:hypothetical protein